MREGEFTARWVSAGFEYYFYYFNPEKQCWAKFYPKRDIPLVIFIETDDYSKVSGIATEIMTLAERNLTPINIRPHPHYDDSWICDFVRPNEVMTV